MKQDKKLMLGMTLLFFITFVSFGTLVVTEKLAPFYTDKIKDKITAYIKENYKEEQKNLTIGKVTYKLQKYQAKVYNKNNKNLYFNVTYQNKKITDTYQKDYLEGKTLLTTTEKILEQKIKKELNKKVTITFPLTLDKYTTQIKETLINNDLENINLYNINLSITSPLETSAIVENIEKTATELRTIKINPNHYNIKITNKNENKKLTINNLTQQTLQKYTLTQIINDIINNNESDIIKTNNISYQYSNKGE